MGEEPHLCHQAKCKGDRNRPEIDATQGPGAAPWRGTEGRALTCTRRRVRRRLLAVGYEAEFVRMLAKDGEDTRH